MKRILVVIVSIIFLLNSSNSFCSCNALACSSTQKKSKNPKKYSIARLWLTSYPFAIRQKNWELVCQKAKRFPRTINATFFNVGDEWICNEGFATYQVTLLGKAILDLQSSVVAKLLAYGGTSVFDACLFKIKQNYDNTVEEEYRENSLYFLRKDPIWHQKDHSLIKHSCFVSDHNKQGQCMVRECEHSFMDPDYTNVHQCIKCVCPPGHYENDLSDQCSKCKVDYIIASAYINDHFRLTLQDGGLITDLIDIVESYWGDRKIFCRKLIADNAKEATMANAEMGGYW